MSGSLLENEKHGEPAILRDEERFSGACLTCSEWLNHRVSACEGLLQLALDFREVLPEDVLKPVLLINVDILVGWASVFRSSIDIAAALLLFVHALHAHLSEPLPVEAPWFSRSENRGREVP